MRRINLKISLFLIILPLLIISTSCLSSPEIIFVYPKVPAPESIISPVRPDWIFLTKENEPDYIFLSVSDSDLLHDYIVAIQEYGKLLQSDIDYYRLVTDWETLQE